MRMRGIWGTEGRKRAHRHGLADNDAAGNERVTNPPHRMVSVAAGRNTIAIALAACVLLAGAPSAMAGTARVHQVPFDVDDCKLDAVCATYPVAEFTAAAGETNNVSVTPVAPLAPVVYPEVIYPQLLISDSSPIALGQGCTALSPTTASCAGVSIGISTGDMDDVVTVSEKLSAFVPGSGAREIGGTAQISGGAGADRLVGGQGDDSLQGQEGRDSLHGRGGNDELKGDKGRGSVSVDMLDGGKGKDEITYEGRRGAVSVRLGRHGGEDSLKSIESATGGLGNDLLIGNSRGNVLHGGTGTDQLRGRGGRDVLMGGTGADRLRGGGGNDLLGWPGRPGSVIKCGAGRDTVETITDEEISARDLIPADCERANLYNLVIGSPRQADAAGVEIRCAAVSGIELFGGPRIALFKGRTLLGRSSRVRRKGRVVVRLTRAGRQIATAGTTVTLSERGEFVTSYRVAIR